MQHDGDATGLPGYEAARLRDYRAMRLCGNKRAIYLPKVTACEKRLEVLKYHRLVWIKHRPKTT